MGGGVSPYEWIVPVVGATHLAVNAGLQAGGGGRSKLVTPGSAIDKEKAADEDAQNAANDLRAKQAKDAADYLAANPPAQTPEEEEASRKRAQMAGAFKLGGKRPSQYLSDSDITLGTSY